MFSFSRWLHLIVLNVLYWFVRSESWGFE